MRIARRQLPGLVHHLIWRCLNREWLIADDRHRTRYLWWLGRALESSDWKCIAYAVMSNHIHIAAIAGEEPLARWSRRVNTPFALWMNDNGGRLGPFFAGRATDWALGPVAATSTIAYIHNNPVRAGLVGRARDSDWTSHGAYVGVVPAPRWLCVEDGLLRAGVGNVDDFERYVDGQPIPPSRPRANTAAMALRRNGQIHEATPLDAEVPLLVRQFGRVRPDPGRVLVHAAQLLELDPESIASRRRHPRLREARVIIAHTSRMLGLTGGDVANALGVSQQAVSVMQRHVSPPVGICRRLCEALVAETRIAGSG
jgi:hypothetical protein